MKRAYRYICIPVICIVALIVTACSATKHVPQGMYLLDNVSIEIDNDSLDVKGLYNFLRQQPNHKVLGFLKLQLATYSLSGRDSTKWYNRWLRSMGQPPVIYDEDLTDKSRQNIRRALINKGFMGANVQVDTVKNEKKRRMGVKYRVTTGDPHYIASVTYDIPDERVREIIAADTTILNLRPGDIFDRNRLDELRGTITERLHNNGYYTFVKDFITFTADTVAGDKGIALTMNVKDAVITRPVTPDVSVEAQSAAPDSLRYAPYIVRKIVFVTDYNPNANGDQGAAMRDSVDYKGITVIYGADRYLEPSILEEKCFIQRDKPYSASTVDLTYRALAQLSIVRFVNIAMEPGPVIDGEQSLTAYIMISRNKKQGITLELEGTNSEGDLGFGVGATYQNRNLFRRSEMFTAKFRTSYESLSGNFDGLVNNRYTEYAGELGLTFPKFQFPFLSSNIKKRLLASTEFTLSANYQERPEYTRIIAGAAWKYKWTRRRVRRDYNVRNTFDLIDINYVRLPRSTINFLDSVAPSNPLLRYSYEDHFIMRMGISMMATNKRIPTGDVNAFAIQPSVTTVRLSAEMAGNLLYGISSLLHRHRPDEPYKIFGIQYAQYLKGEGDYSYIKNFNSRNALAFHVGLGIAFPYGNSRMVPFEKRFYAGGANSVRGWSVRTLGPGAYDARNSVTDFINQCGDILLNLSMEYRAKLFWVFEGALFVDAGNIWTIRDYENQPGGVFRFDEFYKQMAVAYGVGLRLDFTYFLLRFDLGVKAHNPAANQEQWPLLHPNWKRDANFHFAVGYPF